MLINILFVTQNIVFRVYKVKWCLRYMQIIVKLKNWEKYREKFCRIKKRYYLCTAKHERLFFKFCRGRYQSGQMGLTVTQLATPSVVRIHLCPQASKKQMRTSRTSESISKFTWLCRAQPRMPSLRSKCGNSSADRALAFQAGGRGFESRFPLSKRFRNEPLFFVV